MTHTAGSVMVWGETAGMPEAWRMQIQMHISEYGEGVVFRYVYTVD